MKRAQAAMEFLMTYGWAILVVLVAIGALAYFGVLSPDKFLPERCTGPAGLDCIDKAAIIDTKITFAIKNNLGYPISNLIENLDGVAGDCPDTASGATITFTPDGTAVGGIPSGTNIRVEVTCTDTIPGPRVKSDITIEYTNAETGQVHTSIYSITGRKSN